MANISDIIEKFIIVTMGTNDFIEISRNSLAEHFSCAPSQINYVLDTRFTVDKGYLKDSKLRRLHVLQKCRSTVCAKQRARKYA